MANKPTMLGAFMKDKNVASIAPTSEYCVRKILDAIEFRPHQVIVEYGPGSGAFTSALLERMAPDSLLVAIETNEDFVRELRETLGEQHPISRFKVVHDSAENALEQLHDLGI